MRIATLFYGFSAQHCILNQTFIGRHMTYSIQLKNLFSKWCSLHHRTYGNQCALRNKFLERVSTRHTCTISCEHQAGHQMLALKHLSGHQMFAWKHYSEQRMAWMYQSGHLISTYASLKNFSQKNSSQLRNCSRFLSPSICAQVTKKYFSTLPGQKPSISAVLSVKRTVRKKQLNAVEELRHIDKNVTAYALSEELLLDDMKKALMEQKLYEVINLPEDVTDVLAVKAIYKINPLQREIFYFRDGSVVCWDMSESERREILRFAKRFTINPYSSQLVMQENESMEVVYSTSTGLVGDKIYIKERDDVETEAVAPDDDDDETSQILEKYTFSDALSQAVRLSLWEANLEQFVDSIEPVTEDLRDGRKVKISRREVLQKLGEIFALRHYMNLRSDLLDTPDFYWDRPKLENLYKKLNTYLSIFSRTRVMNEKLNYCCQIMELLNGHLNDDRHVRLEWMIVILIVIEVIFEIIHYAERYITSLEVMETNRNLQTQFSNNPTEPSLNSKPYFGKDVASPLNSQPHLMSGRDENEQG
ncbi:hypothetical protein CHS0354_013247 [Potamilus streckersoni]|uniref:DUF155 domain-containing protein n=1 Tax=Potamilus streckersoni TaxID=2493646 RepID=A0AAE0VPI9_9BIVA|nr:hypothetical protein CHS0354_013247 [Potamilus streckersoni]